MWESIKNGNYDEAFDIFGKSVGDTAGGVISTGVPTQLSLGFASGFVSGEFSIVGCVVLGSL